jgi:hypothetical protein
MAHGSGRSCQEYSQNVHFIISSLSSRTIGPNADFLTDGQGCEPRLSTIVCMLKQHVVCRCAVVAGVKASSDIPKARYRIPRLQEALQRYPRPDIGKVLQQKCRRT